MEQADKMKLQILYIGLDPNVEGEVVSFFNDLDT
jgi:hypothetical protein